MSLPVGQTLLFSVVFVIIAWHKLSIAAPFSRVQITSALEIPGELSSGLQLVLDPSRGYCVGNIPGHPASWRFQFFFRPDAVPSNLSLIFKGFLNLQLRFANGQSKRLALASEGWQESKVSLVELPGHGVLWVDFLFSEKQAGEIATFGFDREAVPFDEYFDYVKTKWEPVQQESSEFPLGINIEAEYLFLELDLGLRKKLVEQALLDGFTNIRIHKLYRVYQNLGWFRLKPMLENFLDLLAQKEIDLYLDLLSYPQGNGFEEGWKQSFFLAPDLQDELRIWLKYLNEVQVDGVSFFRWKGLKFVCLINENSLFHEESSSSLDLILREFTEAIIKEGFHSLDEFKVKRMCSVYHDFKDELTRLGYSNIFFLSNYQAGGEDLKAQERCSSNIDRHFYLDYPVFRASLARVHNLSPISRLDETLKHYRQLLPSSGGFISEFNLPWPNRFQHELVPLILYLMKEVELKGLWFYDYRLRTVEFHSGGIFGIQRFRSIIDQLPYFREALRRGYRVLEAEPGKLKLKGDHFFVESGIFDLEGLMIPMTRWVMDGQVSLFSLEKAEFDRFHWSSNFQVGKGRERVEVNLEKFNK